MKLGWPRCGMVRQQIYGCICIMNERCFRPRLYIRNVNLSCKAVYMKEEQRK